MSKIPVDNVFTEALVMGLPVVEYSPDGVSKELERLWETISYRLNT